MARQYAQLRKILRDPIGGSAKEFADYLQSELVRWADVVRAANIRVD